MSRESVTGRRITHTLECSEKLVLAKSAAQEQLDASRGTLDDLDELGDIMSDMLQKQQDVEVRFPRDLPLDSRFDFIPVLLDRSTARISWKASNNDCWSWKTCTTDSCSTNRRLINSSSRLRGDSNTEKLWRRLSRI